MIDLAEMTEIKVDQFFVAFPDCHGIGVDLGSKRDFVHGMDSYQMTRKQLVASLDPVIHNIM